MLFYGKNHNNPIKKKLVFGTFNLWGLMIGCVTVILSSFPLNAAEKVYLNYGFLNFSISVKSLETFAKEGKVDKELSFYLNFLNPQQKTLFRNFLRTRYDINPTILYRLSRSYAGERVLTFSGNLIKIQGGSNGYYAIRGAIIQAVNDPEGLSPINILRKFPTNIELDVKKILEYSQEIFTLIKETKTFVNSLQEETLANATSSPKVDFEKQLDLRNIGQFKTFVKTINFYDSQRKRRLITDVYLPQANQKPLPVIIISNGLGAKANRFSSLAHHLASHGFAVVIPDHPNSNNQRQKDFNAGFFKETFDAAEFVDRPLDISFILNQLEQLNSTQFNNQLNLQQAGLFGYSFGGTTALALAGANLNFEHLKKECDFKNLINISILYQCRALELPQQIYKLQDNRIKAAFGVVPFGKSIYGKEELNRVQIPFFWQAIDEDMITPLLIEQVPAFTWLSSPNKYLAVSEKLVHSRTELTTVNQWTNRDVSADKLKQVSQNYLNALSLAFFQVYLADNDNYRQYLQASYAKFLTEKPYNLNLVKTIQLPRSSLMSNE